MGTVSLLDITHSLRKPMVSVCNLKSNENDSKSSRVVAANGDEATNL